MCVFGGRGFETQRGNFLKLIISVQNEKTKVTRNDLNMPRKVSKTKFIRKKFQEKRQKQKSHERICKKGMKE